MTRKWDTDSAFCQIAELLWPEDYTLGRSYDRKKGKVHASARMQERYLGFRAFRDVLSLRHRLSGIVRNMTDGAVQ